MAQTVESQSRPIQISAQAGKKHTVFLGSTGCGKTTAMSHLILSDIQSKHHSVVVVDAKGQLTHELLERTPTEHDEDIVVISPTSKRIVGINLSSSLSTVSSQKLLQIIYWSYLKDFILNILEFTRWIFYRTVF